MEKQINLTIIISHVNDIMKYLIFREAIGSSANLRSSMQILKMNYKVAVFVTIVKDGKINGTEMGTGVRTVA